MRVPSGIHGPLKFMLCVFFSPLFLCFHFNRSLGSTSFSFFVLEYIISVTADCVTHLAVTLALDAGIGFSSGFGRLLKCSLGIIKIYDQCAFSQFISRLLVAA